MKMRTKIKVKTQRGFNVQAFLDSAGVAREAVEYGRNEAVFAQGDSATTVRYVKKAGIKLSFVSATGKEAAVAMLGPGDFFGEGCLAGQPLRIGTAAAITPSTVLVIEKQEMSRLLHVEHALSDRFIHPMLSRTIRTEEDLVHHLLN